MFFHIRRRLLDDIPLHFGRQARQELSVVLHTSQYESGAKLRDDERQTKPDHHCHCERCGPAIIRASHPQSEHERYGEAREPSNPSPKHRHLFPPLLDIADQDQHVAAGQRTKRPTNCDGRGADPNRPVLLPVLLPLSHEPNTLVLPLSPAAALLVLLPVLLAPSLSSAAPRSARRVLALAFARPACEHCEHGPVRSECMQTSQQIGAAPMRSRTNAHR
jgi:hypothetical protein